MGIKNIHILLITASVVISGIFGVWGIKNNYVLLGYVSLAAAVGLVVYGVQFLKKVKSL